MLKLLSLLALLCGTIVVVQSTYVGDKTVYSLDKAAKRAELHQAILENKPFRGDWVENKTNNVNVRILAVYAVAFASRVTGIGHARLYKLLDMVTLFATLMLLVLYLKKWARLEYCIIAVLFLGAILPMTYAFHFFHPWDRPGALLWLLFAWAVRENSIGACALILFVSILNKYDSIILPGLYFMAHVSRADWKAVTVRTMGLLVVSVATYAALRIGLPDGAFPRDIPENLARNLERILALNIAFPPMLGFSLPMILVVIGWRAADRFSRASFVFGLFVLMGPLFFLTYFDEIRAQIGVFFLMLPAALIGLQSVLVGTHHESDPQRRTAGESGS